MLLNSKATRNWLIATVLMALIATAAYIAYLQMHHRARLRGPSGSDWPAVTFGIVGASFMLFAMLLSMKKRVRTMRIGRAYWWVHGHVWLGLLSYPLICFHAGFRWGQMYGLTWWLMLIFSIIIVSGILGILIQNIVPSKMLRELPLETIYEQIDHVSGELQKESARIVETVTTAGEEDAFELEVIPAGGAISTLSNTARVATARERLKGFYTGEIEPFLGGRNGGLKKLPKSNAAFDQLRREMPGEMQSAVNDLQSIVDERRQLIRQRRMHHILHGWLLIHVPLSFALSVLAIVHIVMAYKYI